MDMLGSFFGGSSSTLVDGAKLVLIGSTLDTARRVGQSAWSSFLSSFYLTAHFDEASPFRARSTMPSPNTFSPHQSDYPFDWLQYWLIRQPSWRSSREFETTTRTTTAGRRSTGGDELEDYEEDAPEEFGKQKMKVVFQPTFDSTITIFYKNHWLRVKRWRNNGSETISISVVARNNQILKSLVLEAKKLYEADAEHSVNVYFADSSSHWRWTDSRAKRPMSSIVLQKGVKEMLLSDTRDFLRSQAWYQDRGIPFRRGYLLHGVPGSGKSSLIHALAGELGLDIYVVSLSSNWINDATLSTLMGRVPARCMVLLEDIDAAFTRSANRDEDDRGVPGGGKGGLDADKDAADRRTGFGGRHSYVPDYNTLSLSGLLNALDGVSAPEGRILFATTNHLERLDPALTRPGRMDVWVEFKNASKHQAELLFRNFFPTAEPDTEVPPPPTAEEIKALDREFAKFEAQGSGAEALANLTMANADEDPLEYDAPIKPLSPERLAELSREFAAAVPEGEHSVASLQGYLLKNKSRPEAAVREAPQWVQSERDLRERLMREKQEREVKLNVEREKRKKEREEQKRRADRDEARRQREEEARIRKEDEEFAAEERRLAEEKRLRDAGLPVPPATPPAAEVPATTPPTVPASLVSLSQLTAADIAALLASLPVPSGAVASAPVPAAAEAAPASPVSASEVTLEAAPASTSDTTSEDGETPGAASVILVKPEHDENTTVVAPAAAS